MQLVRLLGGLAKLVQGVWSVWRDLHPARARDNDRANGSLTAYDH